MNYFFLFAFGGTSLGILILDSYIFKDISLLPPQIGIFLVLLGLFIERVRKKKIILLCLSFFLILGGLVHQNNLIIPKFSTPISGNFQGKILQIRPPKIFLHKTYRRFLVEGIFYSPKVQIRGKMYLSLEGDLDLQNRNSIIVEGILYPFPKATNPYQKNWRKCLFRKGIMGTLRVKEKGIILIKSKITIQNIFEEVRSVALKNFEKLSFPANKILPSLLLCHKTWKDQKFWEVFQKTGSTHFFAISGLHLGIIFLAFWSFFHFLGLSWRKVIFFSLLGITFYVPITGWKSPVLRAYLMILVYFGGELLLQPKNIWNSLGLAGTILLLIWPSEIFQIGFTLSFVSLGGILLLFPILEKTVHLPKKNWLLKKMGQLFFVSLSAWIVTAPMISSCFGIVTPLGMVSNILLFIFIFLLLYLGFLFLILSCLASYLGSFLIVPLNFLSICLFQTNTFLLKSHFSFQVIPPSSWKILFFYLFLMGILFQKKFIYKANFFSFLLLFFFFFFFVSQTIFHPKNSKLWKITFLDVGHGLATRIKMPSNFSILYDCGSDFEQDVGKTIVDPYLRGQGSMKIDLVVLSHPDRDHIRGIFHILDNFQVGEIWISPSFKRKKLGRILIQKIGQKKIFLRVVSTGDVFSLGRDEQIKVLGPPKFTLPYKIKTNDRSILLQIFYQNHSLLLSGDMEEWETSYLLRKKKIMSDIFLLPHHGAKNLFHKNLSQQIFPQFVIHSGRKPIKDEIGKNYSSKKCKILSTKSLGAIEMNLENGKWTWNGFLKKER